MKKNYKKEIYKTREDWLSHRGIGGSDAAAICNKSKWRTACDVYKALTSSKQKKEIKNTRMVEGTKAEPLIRNLFELEHPEYKVIHPPKKGSWLFRAGIKFLNEILILAPTFSFYGRATRIRT